MLTKEMIQLLLDVCNTAFEDFAYGEQSDTFDDCIAALKDMLPQYERGQCGRMFRIPLPDDED